MKVTAIIAEYNPFHLGHKYHIEQAKKLTNADIILVIMSGNFVQRGEPAIFDKHLRAKVAISNGADMVIELPYPYSCASAEYFADSAVTLLHKLGCIDSLCFGCEWDNIDDLYTIADILVNEPDEYKASLRELLKTGSNFPKARQMALMNILKEAKYEDILSLPNNILGIEYIKSLIRLNSNIKPVGIKRIVSDYHHNEDNNPYYSASSIRDKYSTNTIKLSDLATISAMYEKNPLYPIEANDFSRILGYRLLENKDKLAEFLDISDDLADRIANNIDKYKNFSEFIEFLKTKNTNYSSISRGLCHIMLSIKTNDINEFRKCGYGDYVRVLAFNTKSLPIYKEVEKSGTLKLVTKLSKADELLSELPHYNKKIFDKCLFADDLYRLTVQNKYNVTLPNEYQHKLR